MKRIILAAFLGILMMVSSLAQPAAAQLSDSEVKVFVTEMKKNVPMEMMDGMTWQNIRLMDNGVIEYTFTVDPVKLGAESTKAFADEIDGMTGKQMLELLGTEFKSMAEMVGRNVQMVFKYPNGTQSAKRINVR